MVLFMVNERLGSSMTYFDVLKCFATIFITISHLDAFVPDPRFASGGAIGNSLFFLISGYGIQLSIDKIGTAGVDFRSYLYRRLERIYPSTWILVVVGIVFSIEVIDSFSDFIKIFVWPTPFWFVSAISLFYVLFYFFAIRSVFFRKIGLCLLFIPYFIWYFQLDLDRFSVEDDGYFKWVVCFQLVIFGSILVLPLGLTMFFLFSSLFLFLISKLLIQSHGAWGFQFVFQLLAFPISYFFLHLSRSEFLHRLIKNIRVSWLVVVLSMLTLEIYLVQTYWIHWLESKELNFSFPIPLLFAVLPIVPLSYLAYALRNYILSRMFKAQV